jgi:hypothetical protein
MENRVKVLLTVALIVQELIDSSSSESNDELLKYLERNINSNLRRRVQRIENYVDEHLSSFFSYTCLIINVSHMKSLFTAPAPTRGTFSALSITSII